MGGYQDFNMMPSDSRGAAGEAGHTLNGAGDRMCLWSEHRARARRHETPRL